MFLYFLRSPRCWGSGEQASFQTEKRLRRCPSGKTSCQQGNYLSLCKNLQIIFKGSVQREIIGGRKMAALQRKSHVCIPRIARGLSPNFHIHASVSDLYIPRGVHMFSCSRIGRPIVGIYKLLTDTWIWKLGLRHEQFLFWECLFWIFGMCVCSVLLGINLGHCLFIF